MLRRLEELSNLIGVSGDEGRVRRYIKAELANIDGLDMKTDAMGNLIVHKAGKGPKVMVAAHMDEVGMIVIGALDNGLIAYGQRGIDPRVVVSKRVLVGDEMIEGVIGAKAIHLQTAADRKTVLGHSELFVDIGAKDKDDALKYVKPGDRIGFATKFKRLGEKRVLGKALDDRVGCNTYAAFGQRLRMRFLRRVHRSGGSRPSRNARGGVQRCAGCCDSA